MATSAGTGNTPTPPAAPTPPPLVEGPYITQHAAFYVAAAPPVGRELSTIHGRANVIPYEMLANIKLFLPAADVNDIVLCGWEGVADILREVEAIALVMARRR